MNPLLILPIAIPLLTAAGGLLCWRSARMQAWTGLAGAVALLAAALALFSAVLRGGTLAGAVGEWPAPFGITLVADAFSAILVLLPGVMGLMVALTALREVDEKRRAFGFYPLTHVLLAGVSGAFLSGDIFNLYVFFEVLLMASFVLMTLGGERRQLEGGLKYVALNLLSSAIFLAAVGILYGAAGSLNLADLSLRLANADGGLRPVLALLFLCAFGIKAALFPFFFWLPASYHTPPAAVSALFAGLLTKVGVYGIVRVFTLLFRPLDPGVQAVVAVMAGASMVLGVLGAIAQNDIRRILAFHSVSQVGYMLMGFAFFTPLGLAGCTLFLVHHAFAKGNLFLIGGWAERAAGTGDLSRLGGLARARPVMAAMFLVSALSLAGLPPFSGFVGKLVLVSAGFDARWWILTAVSLLVSLLTLFSMAKIWAGAFWGAAREPAPAARSAATSTVPIMILVVLMVAMGCGASPLLDLALRAGRELLDPAAYVQAVLGVRP